MVSNRAQLTAYATEVNTTAVAIAQLNDTIVKAKATGVPVNELEDQRDLQVMHLAELTGATASKRHERRAWTSSSAAPAGQRHHRPPDRGRRRRLR